MCYGRSMGCCSLIYIFCYFLVISKHSFCFLYFGGTKTLLLGSFTLPTRTVADSFNSLQFSVNVAAPVDTDECTLFAFVLFSLRCIKIINRIKIEIRSASL